MVYSFFKEEEYNPQASAGSDAVSCRVSYSLMEYIDLVVDFSWVVGCGVLAGSPGSL